MADNAKPVCYNTKLEDITEMPIDIKLFDFRIGRSIGRHGSICSLVWIIAFIKSHGFHISFCRIYSLTDWFGDVHRVIENNLQIIKEILFKTGNLGSIGYFRETAELT